MVAAALIGMLMIHMDMGICVGIGVIISMHEPRLLRRSTAAVRVQFVVMSAWMSAGLVTLMVTLAMHQRHEEDYDRGIERVQQAKGCRWAEGTQHELGQRGVQVAKHELDAREQGRAHEQPPEDGLTEEGTRPGTRPGTRGRG